MTVAIKVENLSKAYQLGQIGTGTISRDIERWWATRVMGKEDPFLKLADVNRRYEKSPSDVVWSLKDVSFDVQQGDAVGIIGKNGAGKSTLLKLLSRVTSPSLGSIKLRGRVASLLEVGTGFHPELTGRENVYLNGSILGMRKREIDRRFDEIVDFSGVERYIDTPVKRYSSGMSVRLAFAVAAHLESEILIVDEVLAVGDAEFQRKCLGKMEEVTARQGRTILFVSHNLVSVQSLCQSAMVLENGQLTEFCDSAKAVLVYRKGGGIETFDLGLQENRAGSGEVRFKSVIFNNNNPILSGKDLLIEIGLNVTIEVMNVRIALTFTDFRDEKLFTVDSASQGISIGRLEGPSQSIRVRVPALPLMAGTYRVNLWIGSGNITIDRIFSAAEFNVLENDYYGHGFGLSPSKHGIFYGPLSEWTLPTSKRGSRRDLVEHKS